MTSGCFLVEAVFFFFFSSLPWEGILFLQHAGRARRLGAAARWPSAARAPGPPPSAAQLLLSCSRPARPCHCKVVLLPRLHGPGLAISCHPLPGWWPCPGAAGRALCQDGLLAPPGFLVGVTPLVVFPLTRGAPGLVPAAVLHPDLQGLGCSHMPTPQARTWPEPST